MAAPDTSDLLEMHTLMWAYHGDPGWWPGDSSFEVSVGAILTQNTSWDNVERSMAGLKDLGLLDPFSIMAETPSSLARVIRSSGYHNQKAAYLRSFCHFITSEFEGNILAMRDLGPEEARRMLLGVRGIGKETADSILCYALGMDVLVIDAYTRRIMERVYTVGWTRSMGDRPEYDRIGSFLMGLMKGDNLFYNRFHALLVLTAKDHCRALPSCGSCPLKEICATGKKGYNRTTIRNTLKGGGFQDARNKNRDHQCGGEEGRFDGKEDEPQDRQQFHDHPHRDDG